jgi:hypothetical protein
LTETLALDHYFSSVGCGEVNYIFWNFDDRENNENTTVTFSKENMTGLLAESGCRMIV